MIAAMDANRVIGLDNRLPWHLPNDMRRFRETTRGHTVVMGRKTYESIGKALPNRQNVILTRDRWFVAEQCVVVHSLDEILELDDGTSEIMVIGGAELYRIMLPYTARLYLTFIDAECVGDETFPEFEASEWAEIQRDHAPADTKNSYDCTFVTLVRDCANLAH